MKIDSRRILIASGTTLLAVHILAFFLASPVRIRDFWSVDEKVLQDVAGCVADYCREYGVERATTLISGGTNACGAIDVFLSGIEPRINANLEYASTLHRFCNRIRVTIEQRPFRQKFEQTVVTAYLLEPNGTNVVKQAYSDFHQLR